MGNSNGLDMLARKSSGRGDRYIEHVFYKNLPCIGLLIVAKHRRVFFRQPSPASAENQQGLTEKLNNLSENGAG